MASAICRLKNVRVAVNKLETLRLNAGLSQRELSKRAGLAEGSVWFIENRGSASPATLKKIADVLGVQVVDLIEERQRARAED
jgi:transcriptional regulator with XRE-family HTH domain